MFFILTWLASQKPTQDNYTAYPVRNRFDVVCIRLVRLLTGRKS